MCNKWLWLFYPLSFFLFTSANAGSLQGGELHLSVGGGQLQQGTQQLIGIVNSLGNFYSVSDDKNRVFVGGLGFFLTPKTYKRTKLSLGTSLFYIGDGKTQGVVHLERSFPNLSYQYKSKHIPLYATGRAVFDAIKAPFAIVADGGIGLNILKTRAFQDRSIDNGITIGNAAFSGNTTVKFSAMAGIGILFDKVIKDHSVAVSYRYFYLNNWTLDKS